VAQALEMEVISPAQGYALWAPSYERETGVSLLDQILVEQFTPPLEGLRLLDVGCGTGRRMRLAGAAAATGVEPSPNMIAAGAAALAGRPELTIVEGHAGALPVPARAFDVIWCRLVLGHVAGLAEPYTEMGRALADGGTVIVSDFHPEAYERGHRRTFRSASRVWEIETHSHALSDHVAAAEAAGLTLVQHDEACVGPEIRDLYVQAGRAALYEDHLGLPLVFALRFERG